MPDINDPAETKSIAPSTSRALVTQSLSLVRRGLVLANALLSRQDAEVYYKSGREKVRQHDYRQAVENFTRAIESDPDFAEAYSIRAMCFQDLGEDQKELQDREAVVRLRPHDYYAYTSRALLYEILSNYEEALRDFTQAIELAPEKIAPIFLRGQAYEDLGRYQDAIQDYSRVIELNRKYSGSTIFRSGEKYYIASAYFNRGVIYQKLNMLAEAFDDFRQAAHLGHDPARARLEKQGLK